jgi:hypothetical protein
MLTIQEQCVEDAIINKNNDWLKRVLKIQQGEYDKQDNEIETIEEVCLRAKMNKPLYYYNIKNQEINLMDSRELALISEDEGYQFGLRRNIKARVIKFLRTTEGIECNV